MQNRNSYTILVVLLLSALVTGCSSVMQADLGASAPNLAAQVAQAPSGGPQEGIKVHGHWTIEVREPDGSLVSHTELENALQTGGVNSGDNLIQRVLTRQSSVGVWYVQLLASTGSDPCPNFTVTSPLASPGTAFGCWLTESSSGLSGAGLFKTLSVSAPTSGPDTNKAVLTGSATAQQSGSIGFVLSHNALCGSGSAPSSLSCAGAPNSNTFTVASVTPVSVTAGQQILVTVKISFS